MAAQGGRDDATRRADLFGLAFGIMRLSPDVFWSMTPFEFAAAATPFVQAARPPGRAQLERLMQAHPDTPKPMEAENGR